MKRKLLLPALFFLMSLMALPLWAQGKFATEIAPEADEQWWGGLVALGSRMPYAGELRLIDLAAVNMNNQGVPLMLSSTGRYVWSDRPFRFEVKGGRLCLYSDYEELLPQKAGTTLREAYRAASAAHFPPSGKLPDSLFFSMPQYNTWIELMYNQNEADILAYADNIRKNDFPVGVFMVDDNWQQHYGNFDFKADRFPDPKGMIDRLHAEGFKIMLWICPFVSPDSPEFRMLQKKGYLIREKASGHPALIPWWNGYSACYDMSNPAAASFFKDELKKMQTLYGVDGFKFDAGDVNQYTGDYAYYDTTATSVDMCEYWAKVGLDFPFNEYRAGWKMGGEALVQRLGDKDCSWNAVSLLISDMISAGLMGHLYTCPDMVGGGQIGSFLDVDQSKLDQKLIVRSCQVHALMPMMQFSVAPWRILSPENLAICRTYAHLHEAMGTYILKVASEASQTGEPMVRSMEYVFPHQGFINCKDQFMLGDKYLVAPIITADDTRRVLLPKGVWKDDQGKKLRGPQTLTITAGLERLPYYERIK